MVIRLLSVALAPETTKTASSLVTALVSSHTTPCRRKKTMTMDFICRDLSLKLGSQNLGLAGGSQHRVLIASVLAGGEVSWRSVTLLFKQSEQPSQLDILNAAKIF